MKARILTLAAAATVAALPLAAQSATANFNATATVVSGLTVQNTSSLAFGNVFPGINKAVPTTDANSALIEFAGANNAEVTLAFGALPANLTSGGNNLPIVFSVTDGAHNTTNDRATATQFDPTTVATTNLSGTGSLWAYLGGTVQPGAAQPAGAYTAALTLVATYTGN